MRAEIAGLEKLIRWLPATGQSGSHSRLLAGACCIALCGAWPVLAQALSADIASSLSGTDGESIADVLDEADPDLSQIQAQIDAGEYEIPKAWLSHKIEQIEGASHRFDPALVRPITMLGDIMALEGNFVGALDNYGRAIHLERVNSGLVSPRQVEIVYREAEVYRTLGDFKQANRREEYAYHVLRSAHDPYDEDLLPGLFHLAQLEAGDAALAAAGEHRRVVLWFEHDLFDQSILVKVLARLPCDAAETTVIHSSV